MNSFFDNKNYNSSRGGYVAMLTVIILSTVIILLTISMQTSTRNVLSSADVMRDYFQSRYAVDACAEVALQYVRDTDSTSGTGSETINNASCSYTIVSAGSESFGLNVTAEKNNTYYEVDITADALFPAINLTSWERQ